ncbi:MAG: VOC family protein [Actinomycetota bacterium]|nr:VOC family protein [Actinomycetota bacterium]
MRPDPTKPVVHLELHTGDLERARAFYTALCGWRPERIEHRCGAYEALELGGRGGVGGGIVECATERPLWLPYVEVGEVARATERARRLGARVLLEPREGPAGWRSVVSTPAGGEIAFWQPKR